MALLYEHQKIASFYRKLYKISIQVPRNFMQTYSFLPQYLLNRLELDRLARAATLPATLAKYITPDSRLKTSKSHSIGAQSPSYIPLSSFSVEVS